MGAVKAKFGRIDALLNIAGGFQWERVEDGEAESWDRVFALNLKTALNACKAAFPTCCRAARAASSMSARNPPFTRRQEWAPTPPANRRCTG